MVATNWAGNVTLSAGRVYEPTSLDELRRIVTAEPRIRALGAGHSFSDIVDSPGALVRLDQLPRSLTVDAESGIVTVSGAYRYAEIVGRIHDAGRALPNMASLPHITVAGAVATATHGSGDAQPVLSASVVGLRLVGADGDLIELRRDTHDAFAGAVVNLGALGVVTEVTLQTVAAFDMAQWVELDVPLEAVGAGLDTVFAAAYSVSVFTDWHSDRGVVWHKCRADDAVAPRVGGRPADTHINPCPGMPADRCTAQLGEVGPWHDRLPHFRAAFSPSAGDELQSEYFVARADAPAMFEALRSLGDVIGPAVMVAEVRSVMADDLWLSPAFEQDVMAFHFTWRNDPAKVWPAIEAIEARAQPLGVRSHWAKLTAIDPAGAIRSYRRAQDFDRLARSLDPAGKFRNPFVTALFA